MTFLQHNPAAMTRNPIAQTHTDDSRFMTAPKREIGRKNGKLLLTFNQLFVTKTSSQKSDKTFPMKTTILRKPAARLACRLAVSASVTAVALLITCQNAFAPSQIYNFTFTGNDGIDASGTVTIDTVANVATSGSVNVVNVPLESLPGTTTASGYLLTAGGDVRDFDGDVVTYDTVANPANNPVFDGTGVGFGSSIINSSISSLPATYDGGTPVYDTIVNIWGNGPGSFGMFIGEANPADLNPDGTLIAGRDAQWVYVYNESGSMTITAVPVPEPTTAALLLGALAVGFVAIRRRRATA